MFQRTKDDEKVALSLEDEAFLEIMDRNVYINDANGWVAPLPFRNPRRHLPNNREQAAKRLSSLSRTLERKPDIKKQYIEFMQKTFESGQASSTFEERSRVLEPTNIWCLPSPEARPNTGGVRL